MLVNGWHANHIFGNWIITEMLFLEFASVGPMLGQADISTLAQRRTNGWITIGMFTGRLHRLSPRYSTETPDTVEQAKFASAIISEYVN